MQAKILCNLLMKVNLNTFTEFCLLEAITGPAQEGGGYTGHEQLAKEKNWRSL